jgi:hypothetical protein
VKITGVLRVGIATVIATGLALGASGVVRVAATRTIEYLVRGTGTMTVTYDSAKGGKAAATVAVK